MSRKIFRQEAVEYHAARGLEGDILRFDTTWLRWTYRLVLCAVLAALLYIICFDVNEYASGIAFVRVEGRRTVANQFAGTVESVSVQPGQHVKKGQVLVTMSPNAEDAELHRASAEFSLHLAQLLRDPADLNAKSALASLRPRREQALMTARHRFLRAPEDGIVTDVRAKSGQHIDARSIVLGIAPPDAEASLVCVVPGDYRPMLKRDSDIRFALDGFKFEYRSVKVDSVGEEVIGPVEMKRYLGPELADALPIVGPSVLVRGRLPTRTFKADGQTYTYVEGLTARVDVRVRSEPIIIAFLPALKALRPRP